jgi:hypothetical protein
LSRCNLFPRQRWGHCVLEQLGFRQTRIYGVCRNLISRYQQTRILLFTSTLKTSPKWSVSWQSALLSSLLSRLTPSFPLSQKLLPQKALLPSTNILSTTRNLLLTVSSTALISKSFFTTASKSKGKQAN